MSDNYFRKLETMAIKIDSDIKDLTESWRYPHKILEGYGADDETAATNIQNLNTEIKTLKNTSISDVKSRAEFMTETDTFSLELQQRLEDLMQSCSDVETVLSEYGYVAPEVEKLQNQSYNLCSASSSLISSDVNDDLVEIEFTPDMSWRHRAKINISQGNENVDRNLVSKLDKLFSNNELRNSN